MALYIGHESALEFWRGTSNTPRAFVRTDAMPRAADGCPDAAHIDAFLARHNAMTRPLHLLVSSPSHRTRAARCHVCRRADLARSFFKLECGNFVASPELCFLQLAGSLDPVELALVGFELCGTYRIRTASHGSDAHPPQPAAALSASVEARSKPTRDAMRAGCATRRPRLEEGPDAADMAPRASRPLGQAAYRAHPSDTEAVFGLPRLTGTKRLEAFLEKASGAYARQRALKALRLVEDGSASPMESILAILLCAPRMIGGYGIEKPLMNARIDIDGRFADPTDALHLRCDFLWPRHDLCLEYDSDAFHTGPERIAKDSARRNALAHLGLTVVTVTTRQIYRENEMDRIARTILHHVGSCLRQRTYNYQARKSRLRRMLLER